MEDHSTKKAQIIQLNESAVRDHLGEMVRNTVEDTLNNMLDAEADRLCNAEKYQRHEARTDTRAGHYQRKLHTKAGEVTLNMPKLRQQTFETAIIERYRRREASIEESLIEMYLAGVSVRRIEDITETLWGTKVSPGTISNLNKKVYVKIEEWRNRPIIGEHPYVYVVPAKRMPEVAAMLKAIHASEDKKATIEKAEAVFAKLEAMKLKEAAKKVQESIIETLSYYDFPREHRIRIRTNNALEQIMKEIRRRTRVVGAFPDGHSALMLCAARLRHIAGTQWRSKRYLNIDLLKEQEQELKFEIEVAA